VVDIRLPRKAGPLTKAFRVIGRMARAVVLTIGRHVRMLAQASGRTVHSAALLATRTAARAYWAALKYGGNAAEWGVDLCAITVRVAWIILEPQIRAFDKWLEKRLNRNDVFRGIVATHNDAHRLLLGWRAQVRSRFSLPTED